MVLLTRQDGPASISRGRSGRSGGASSCAGKRRLLLPPAMHSSAPPGWSTSLKRCPPPPAPLPPTSVSAEASLVSTSLGLHNKKLTELMCKSLPASHSLPHASSRRTGSLFNPQTPPTTHSPLHPSGAGVLPGVPFGKRCQWGNMDVSCCWWWCWVGGGGGGGVTAPSAALNSLYSNYCSPLLQPPATARLYQAARPHR